MKLSSWNVNGIRAILRKGNLQEYIRLHDPDILCLQETKAKKNQIDVDFKHYHEYWNSADKPGYSGTAIFSKIPAISVINNIPDDICERFRIKDSFGDANREGRVLVAEYDDFFVATVYTPNAKPDLSRLTMRHKGWDPAFLEYMKLLEKTKPVLFCGDLNVAYTEDDLANPKANIGEHGFTDEEREGFKKILDADFIDTFRLFTQGNGHYTWWTHFAQSRARNIGWRIDYWMASRSLRDRIVSSHIHADIMGSDHCPVSIILQ